MCFLSFFISDRYYFNNKLDVLPSFIFYNMYYNIYFEHIVIDILYQLESIIQSTIFNISLKMPIPLQSMVLWEWKSIDFI